MLEKKFYNIEEMGLIFGKTIASIYGHLARKQLDVIPPPIKLGRRLAWPVKEVDRWIEGKTEMMNEALEEYRKHIESKPRKRGRPRKGEEKSRML